MSPGTNKIRDSEEVGNYGIPKSSKLHRYVNKVRKRYHARYKCNNKRDPKIINFFLFAITVHYLQFSVFTSHAIKTKTVTIQWIKSRILDALDDWYINNLA